MAEWRGAQGVKAERGSLLGALSINPSGRALEGHLEGRQSSVWDVWHTTLLWAGSLLVRKFGKRESGGLKGITVEAVRALPDRLPRESELVAVALGMLLLLVLGLSWEAWVVATRSQQPTLFVMGSS